MPKRKVILEDWGRISYQAAWDKQTTRQKALIKFKRFPETTTEEYHRLIFCEHPPVFTLGKSGSPEHLLLNEKGLRAEGVEYFKINRGGDITFHGPGQIVGYPILDLDDFDTDVRKYVRKLEQVIINVLDQYGIEAEREEGYTGVWLPQSGNKSKRKICAIGIHLSRWVSMHGFAFNVNTDLSYFEHIIPCGINENDKSITSMALELGEPLDLVEIKTKVANEFARLFHWEWMDAELHFPSFEQKSHYE